MARGMPGKPPPVPTSKIAEPLGKVVCLAIASE